MADDSFLLISIPKRTWENQIACNDKHWLFFMSIVEVFNMGKFSPIDFLKAVETYCSENNITGIDFEKAKSKVQS